MLKFINSAFLLGVMFILKLLGKAFFEGVKEASKGNLVITAILLAVAAIYLGISYSRHREVADNASNEALRIASAPGTTENDWAPLLHESEKSWEGSSLIVVPAIGVFSSFLGSLIDLFLDADDSDQTWTVTSLQ